nr:solute carrier family 22 member 7-like isoform X2 [Procambarus clarkii]
MAFEFDDVLEQIGSFGRYQKFAIFILLFPSGFFSAFMMNQLLFQVVVPDHWCHVPGRETTGMSTDEWRALTIPRSNSSGRYSSCLRYKVTWSGNASFSPSEGDSASFSPSEGDNASFSPSEGDNAGFSPSEEDSASFSPSEGRNASFFLSNKTEECRSGWEFDSSQFKATLATTNQWFCERESYSQHALALNMAGNAFGTLILPFIGDKYVGRRVILYVALAIHVVFTIPLVWISNVGFHLLFRFLAGLGYLSYSLVPYVIVVETVGSRRRALTTGLYYGTWTAGMCFTALVAFLVPHWQYLALISCVPPIIFLLFLRLVPESPRWLLSKGRVTECARILLQVAKTNGNQEVTKQDLKKKLCDIVDKQVEEVSIKNALRYPILRWRLVSLLTIAMCVYMSYGVILMGINVLPSNYFLSHFILSVSQLPATATSWVFMQYLGRRFSSMASALLFIVLCVVATFCTHVWPGFQLPLLGVGGTHVTLPHPLHPSTGDSGACLTPDLPGGRGPWFWKTHGYLDPPLESPQISSRLQCGLFYLQLLQPRRAGATARYRKQYLTLRKVNIYSSVQFIVGNNYPFICTNK